MFSHQTNGQLVEEWENKLSQKDIMEMRMEDEGCPNFFKEEEKKAVQRMTLDAYLRFVAQGGLKS